LYNKEKNYNKLPKLIVVVLLLLFSLFSTAYTAKNPKISKIGYNVLNSILNPFQLFLNNSTKSLISFFDDYINLINIKEENFLLSKRIEVLRVQNSKLVEIENENKRLKKLLKHKSAYDTLNTISAEVISKDPLNWQESLIIGRGKESGIKERDVVISGSGIVGIVISVGNKSSKVLLITDYSSSVAGILQDTRVKGIISGSGGAVLKWNYVQAVSGISAGDRIVTSGLDGVYPKGLIIGYVNKINKVLENQIFSNIYVKSEVDFDNLETVLVVLSSNE